MMKNIIYSILLFVLISSCNDRFNDSDTYIHNGLKVDKNWKPITGIVFDVYPNDSIKFEIEYLNGELNGVYKEFYENGQLKKEGNFVSGQREGSYKGFIDDGRLIIEGYYKNDLKDSIWNKYCFNFSQDNLKTQLKSKYVYKDTVVEFTQYNEGLKGIGTNYNVSGDIFFDEYRSWRIGDSLRIDYIFDSIANKKWEVLFKKYYNTRNIGIPVDSLSGLSIVPKEGDFNLNEFFSFRNEFTGFKTSSNFEPLEFYNISKIYNSNPEFDFREMFPLKLLDFRNESLKYFSQDGTLLFSRKLSEDKIYYNTDYIPDSEESEEVLNIIYKTNYSNFGTIELHFLEYSSQDGTPLFLRVFSEIIIENSKYSVSIDEYGSGVVYGNDDCSFCSDLNPKKYLLKLEENLPCEKVLYYLDIMEELEEL